LDPDLDLEADLGIDTVKQAEVFAAIRQAYGIERDDTLQLRDYPTLNHVVAFVHERAPQAAAPEVEEVAAPVEPEAAAPDVEEVAAPEEPEAAAPAVTMPGAFPRRVPTPILRPPLEHCVPTDVTFGEGSRVVVMPDRGGVGAALAKRLRKLGAEVLTIEGAPTIEEIEAQIAKWTEAGPIQGVYWLPALDPDGDDARQALHIRVKLLAAAMRALDPATFLVSAIRLGGRHGCGGDGAACVLGGAVTGFTKALARERTDTLIKAVDFEPGRKTAAPADLLIEETLRDPGAVEIGHADGLRWTVGLLEEPATPDAEHALTSDDTFVITGAAGSIVSAITADLAKAAQGGTFHLLDLVPAPDAADPDLTRFASDHDGLKAELADRIRERGDKPTPKLVESALARIERSRSALDAIGAIDAAGGTAHWHQVDLTDSEAVREAIGALERIDVLVHAAGLEISHFLPDKPQAEFDLVFDVKAHGWLNLLDAIGDSAPGAAVVFSSIAGRFGNGGQTDYAAASDLLCKSISQLNAAGRTRAVAIDWTAWSGIGMASRGSIPKMMEAAGIDMLPPAEGVPVVRRELTAAGAGGEVLVAGALGVLLGERHPTGGLDVEAVPDIDGPMTGSIAGMTLAEGIRVLTELDPAEQAFLDHHRIDGIAVLPGVMGMEGFAEAARSFAPGFEVVALEDVELLAPFKFYRDEPRTLELRAQVRDGGDGSLIADCELIGRRTLAGQGEQVTRHFTGRARLARSAAPPPTTAAPGHDHAGVGRDAVYRIYFHGPAYQVLEEAWRDNGTIAGRLAADLPPDHEPLSAPTMFVPRLIELCFQTAGVWEIGSEGRLALPTGIERVTRFAGADEPGRLWALVTPRADGTGIDADVVDEDGRVRVRLEGYRTIELPSSLDPGALAAIRAAMGTS
jgi:NAD(P)-dependent dehydrogenase (short-subunit alcohol dehydrogenase family)